MRVIWLSLYSLLWLTSAFTYCPDNCDCIWESNTSLTINCSGRKLSLVPDGIDENVEVLDLSDNVIPHYEERRRFWNLKSINLSKNEISTAKFGFLMSNVEEIDLSHNKISSLAKVEVSDLPKLTKIDLSKNVKLNSPYGLASQTLKDINLSDCIITTMGDNMFGDLPNVTRIDLSRNSFRRMVNQRSETLEELDASGGELQILSHQHLEWLPKLKKFNVSFNKNLSPYFVNGFPCLNITELDYSHCGMNRFSLHGFCSLETLDLSWNNLDNLDPNSFWNASSLSFLDLSYNNLNSVEKSTFRENSKLQYLDLSHNIIRDVSFTLYLKNVEYLSLSDNEVKDLKSLILMNAIELDVSSNRIYELTGDFMKNLPKLKKLDVSDNLIEVVYPIRSSSIVSLNLSSCKIIAVQLYAFSNAKNLREIDLTGNRLVAMDYKIFEDLKQLKTLRLGRNQWSCSCTSPMFRNLYEFVLVNRSLEKADNLHCSEPFNQTWRNVCANDWKESHLTLASRKTFLSLITTFVVILVLIAVFVFCKYMREHKRAEEAIDRLEREIQMESSMSTPREMESLFMHDSIRRSQSAADVPLAYDNLQTSHRASTPPPNYETAMLLPKLSVEQRTEALSTGSVSNLHNLNK